MVIYEVNLEINADIFNEYRTWLQQHIQQILKLPGFTHAQCFEIIDPQQEQNSTASKKICVQYQLTTLEHLNHYIQNHAPAMREEGKKRFGNQFQATRRILRTLEDVNSDSI